MRIETPDGPANINVAGNKRAVLYSVIVPAYNSSRTLAACLRALLTQSTPRGQYEIIVVNDGSTDMTLEVAKSYPVNVLTQQNQGPASARNLGARHALGDIILFTDSDCVPSSNWIEAIARPLNDDPMIAGAKGRYMTCQNSLIARIAQVEFEEKYARLRTQPYIDFVDTYSAAFRKDAFWGVGGFDPVFPVASNEDTELSFKLVASGNRLVFTDEAVVFHKHPESLWYYLLRKWRHAYWRIRVYRSHPRKMAGDSYTPRSTQLQLAATAMLISTIVLRVPSVWPFLFAALFAVSTFPFVIRGLSVGRVVAAAIPFVMFLRAVVMLAGLTIGTIALVFDRPRLAKRIAVDPQGTSEAKHPNGT